MSSDDLSSRRRPRAVSGNPAICHSQTGSFASPPCAGFALERLAVKHAPGGRAPCRTAQTARNNCVTGFVTQSPGIALAPAPFLRAQFQRSMLEKPVHFQCQSHADGASQRRSGFAPKKRAPSQASVAALAQRWQFPPGGRKGRAVLFVSDHRLRPPAQMSGIFICLRLAN
jgi:hypothetical protein